MKNNSYDPLQREYAGLASRYDNRWYAYVQASIRETLQRLDLPAEGRVLDVGCGTGALLAELMHKAPALRYAGVDLSAEMLEVAQRKLGQGVTLKQAPAEELPYADGEFDVVVSTSVFHFIHRPLQALREMRRVLAPAGRVVITDWCDDYLSCRVCDRFLRMFNRAHGKIYNTAEFRRLLTEAGFQDIFIDRYKINWLWGMMTARARKRETQQPPGK